MNIKRVRFFINFKDILSSEDINKILQKQKALKSKNNFEYKILNTSEDEDGENNKAKIKNSSKEEMEELSKEINQQSLIDIDPEEESLDNDKINQLKSEVMNNSLDL